MDCWKIRFQFFLFVIIFLIKGIWSNSIIQINFPNDMIFINGLNIIYDINLSQIYDLINYRSLKYKKLLSHKQKM